MIKKICKLYWLLLVILSGCGCDNSHITNSDLQPPTPQKYYNLEAIDLAIEAKAELSFVYNNQQLKKEGNLYLSKDLFVYQTKDGKWKATVVGQGGINSHLKIIANQTLLQEIPIASTSQVISYQDKLGREWPGMNNIGNTCFANAAYKLIARCTGFDEALSKDMAGGIHTDLRNIVNGIRLGYRSALQEEIVNKKVSELFLNTITKASGVPFNNREQVDINSLFERIESLIYTENTYEVNDEKALGSLITEFKNQKPPFKHILCETNFITKTEDCYVQPKTLRLLTIPDANYWSLSQEIIPPKYLSLPQFILYVFPGPSQENSIVESLKIPLWEHTTNRPLEEKTYKLIGFAYHIGSTTSGHYKAYINFNTYGWYEHNDASVQSVTRPNSINTGKIMAFYELQD